MNNVNGLGRSEGCFHGLLRAVDRASQMGSGPRGLVEVTIIVRGQERMRGGFDMGCWLTTVRGSGHALGHICRHSFSLSTSLL